MPLENTPTTAPETPSQQSAPIAQATSSPSTPTPSPAPSAPTLPDQTAQAQAQAQSVRDALAGYGLDLRNQFQNDHAALQHLAGQAQQLQQFSPLIPYAQEYAQHAAEFRQWQQEQARLKQQQSQQQQSWWKAPEYDPRWQTQLYRDPQSGELRVLPGNDPAILSKYNAWVNHQQNFLNEFSLDPMKAIQPGIEQIIQQQAAQIFQQQMRQQQEHNYAQQFFAQNSEWLYNKDATGNIQRDHLGRPALSPLGQRFAGYVQEAEGMGINDSAGQQKYAMAMMKNDYYSERQNAGGQVQGNATPAVPPSQALKDNFLANAAQQQAANPGTGGNVNAQQVPQQTGLRGLMEMMRNNLAAHGFTAGKELV